MSDSVSTIDDRSHLVEIDYRGIKIDRCSDG